MNIRIVPHEQIGERLDIVATTLFSEYSRSQIKHWIKQEALHVDGESKSPSYSLRGGESLQLDAETKTESKWSPSDIELNIVYEDEHIIVVDKPAGLVVHPGAGNPDKTLVNGLLKIYPELSFLPRCGIVHRLDKDTSGLLVVARSQLAVKNLVADISQHKVKRVYLALVRGNPISGGIIDMPIGRHPVNRKKMAPVSGGRRAVSKFSIFESYSGYALLKVYLETGRTHQIRVHLSHKGLPLLGDQQYGTKNMSVRGTESELATCISKFPRQALHARHLSLRHPFNGKKRSWTSSLPKEISNLVTMLRLRARHV